MRGRSRKLSSLCAASVSGLLFCFISHANGQQLVIPGDILDEEQVKKLNICIETTYQEFSAASESVCNTNVRYYAAGGGGHIRVKVKYKPPAGYSLMPGSQHATQIGGQCEHNIYANWIDASQIECEWETSGCGIGKEGGHVRGFCSANARYILQAGDVAKIKEYCLSTLFGGAPAKPTAKISTCDLK